MSEQENKEIVNIEEIMQEIRQQILEKKDVVWSGSAPAVTVGGKRLPAEFYEHLYQATLVHDQIGVRLHVTKTNVPLIGGLLDNVRGKLHELVLFYVNKLAAEQIQFNTHILQAVNLLAQELEKEAENE